VRAEGVMSVGGAGVGVGVDDEAEVGVPVSAGSVAPSFAAPYLIASGWSFGNVTVSLNWLAQALANE
jgi:hypothetical protein